jgi:NADPH:quinone reductase-like Zn-dependent oxidoreductase
MMKAVSFARTGGSEVLEYGDWPTPRPAAGEVLIAVRAAAVNPRDWLMRSGRYVFQRFLPRLPFVLGSDVAGVVAARGRAVTGLEVGDEVFAMIPTIDGFGGYAEYARAVRAAAIARKPPGLSFAEAAAVPLAGSTALQSLRDDARMRSGQRVLIVGAVGGVGGFAVQVARNLGAAEVVGVCRAENAPLALRLGCHRVVDHQSEPYLDRERGFDVVFDSIGKESERNSRRMLGKRGVYVTTVPSPAAFRSLALSLLWPFGQRSRISLVRSRRADLELFARWAEEGRLQVVLDRQLPLARATEAHDYMRTFRSRGKNVLLIG